MSENDEHHSDVQGLARCATSADMKAMLADMKSEIAALEARMTWRLVLASGFIIGAIGLMLRAMLP